LSIPAEVDIVVIGGGAAGIAAVRRLVNAPVSSVLLEARDRLGGRAHTVQAGGFPVDLGCGWLHSAEDNPWTHIAEKLGLTVDKSPPPWMRQAFDLNFSPQEQRDYRAAFDALEERLEQAAAGPDLPASALLDPGCRWNPLLDAFSGYYNGAPFCDISVHDYAAFEDSGVNWRIAEGYGATIAGYGAEIPAALGAAVTRVDRTGPLLRIETAVGTLFARRAIVTVPTAVIVEGRLKFDPPLPDKQEAADALPLGHVNKAFLLLGEPEPFPVDTHLFGRTDTAETASHHLRPLGRPLIEAFFGGPLAKGLEQEGPGAFGQFAVEELVSLLGSAMRRKLEPVAETGWAADPWTGGAYSHARPGQAGARAALAAPVEGRLFFAGEACSPHAFSTAHGAFESGVCAAEAALASLAG
jgi:monoamine oxidase